MRMQIPHTQRHTQCFFLTDQKMLLFVSQQSLPAVDPSKPKQVVRAPSSLILSLNYQNLKHIYTLSCIICLHHCRCLTIYDTFTHIIHSDPTHSPHTFRIQIHLFAYALRVVSCLQTVHKCAVEVVGVVGCGGSYSRRVVIAV